MSGTAGDLAVPPFARVTRPADLSATLKALDIAVPRPVLVLVGGAGGMTPGHLAAWPRRWSGSPPRLTGGVPRWWTAAPTPVSCGSWARPGTQPGRASRSSEWPLKAPSSSRGRTRHPMPPPSSPTTPRSSWSREMPGAMNRPGCPASRRRSADGQPSLTLVVNGGQITYDDIEHSLRAGRPVIILAGTGRTADAIAAAAHGRAEDPRAARVAASPGTRIASLGDPEALYAAIGSVLAPAG